MVLPRKWIYGSYFTAKVTAFLQSSLLTHKRQHFRMNRHFEEEDFGGIVNSIKFELSPLQ